MPRVNACQICNARDLTDFLSLGHHAPSNAFLTSNQLNEPVALYPLSLCYCNSCGLVQARYVIDKNVLFSNFSYRSGTSRSFAAHLRGLAKELATCAGAANGDVVVDIGCGDGTLLSGYFEYPVKAVGVEPSRSLCEYASSLGITTVQNFFDYSTAAFIKENYGPARIVTATNVIAHVSDIHDFLQGVYALLTDEGVFVSESQYLLDLIQRTEYDMIYHEHLRYYALRPLIRLLNMHKLEVFDVKHVGTHGGSIRVYACKSNKQPENSKTVGDFLNREIEEGLYDIATYRAFAERVFAHRKKLLEVLYSAVLSKGRIVGIGAPDKSNTLLTFCNIGTSVVEYLTELNELKIGRHTPFTHIPIVHENQLYSDNPYFALLLSWNLKEDVVRNLRSKGYTGKIIVPFPDVEIIEA